MRLIILIHSGRIKELQESTLRDEEGITISKEGDELPDFASL
jgi:hypothetical protein